MALSAFGTADQRFTVPAAAPLGEYRVVVQLRRGGRWTDVASAWYRVAEYRPPEFLVDVTADTGSRYAGDSVTAGVEARYLFGAPMGRAAVRWTLRQQSAWPYELEIPGTDGYYLGETGWWYEESGEENLPVQIAASGVDTLDATGRLPLRLKLGETVRGRPSRATVEATVVDVNRQTVSASASLMVHPADFYLGAKPEGDELLLAGRHAGAGRRRRRAARRRPGAGRPGHGHHRTARMAFGAPGPGRLWRTGGRVGVGHRRALCPHDGGRTGVLRLHAAGGWHVHRHLPRGRCRRPAGVDQLLPLGHRQGLGAVERREPVQDGRRP